MITGYCTWTKVKNKNEAIMFIAPYLLECERICVAYDLNKPFMVSFLNNQSNRSKNLRNFIK